MIFKQYLEDITEREHGYNTQDHEKVIQKHNMITYINLDIMLFASMSFSSLQEVCNLCKNLNAIACLQTHYMWTNIYLGKLQDIQH